MKPLYRVCLFCCLTLIFAAIAGLGTVWFWSDFHPGSEDDVPESFHLRAKLGQLMSMPFQIPTAVLIGLISPPPQLQQIVARTIYYLLVPALYAILPYRLVVATLFTRIGHRPPQQRPLEQR